MTTITNDWETHTWTLQMPDGTEYSCKCHVYLTIKEVPDPLHFPPRDQVTGYSLEGWDTIPPMKPEHEKEIERQILMKLEDEYSQS